MRFIYAIALTLGLALIPAATSAAPVNPPAHHCVYSGGGWLCAGDPTNPQHQGEQRIAGADRYATSAAISAASWAPGEAAHVYLANGWTAADALAAGPSVDGPILLVPTGSALPDSVAAELARLAPTTAVVALGGTGSVSDAQLAAAAVAAGFPR